VGEPIRNPRPGFPLQTSIPRRADLLWPRRSRGGDFRLGGAPKEKGWEVIGRPSIPQGRFGESKRGLPLLAGFGARPRGKGWAKTAHLGAVHKTAPAAWLCQSHKAIGWAAWPRGKAHAPRRFPLERSPTNNPLILLQVWDSGFSRYSPNPLIA
jgi:hypothetical protein